MSNQGIAPSSLGKKILRGVLSNLLGQGAVFILSFLLTPWLVRHLGAGGYGFYTFIWSLLSYALIFNFGSFYAAQYFTSKWQEIIERRGDLAFFLRKTFLYVFASGTAAAILVFESRRFIAQHFLHGPSAASGSVVFALISLSIPFYFMAQFFFNLLWGLKRFSLANTFLAVQAFLITGGASLLVYFGFQLKAIAVLFIFSQLVLSLAGLFFVYPLFSRPSSRVLPQDRKDYLSFAAKSALPLIFVTLVSQGDRAAVGFWLSLTQLGYYSLSASLAQKFNSISASVAAVSFPILSELIGKGEEERLRRIYLKAAELSFFALFPLSIFSFILIPQFMSLWLGTSFSQACTWPFRMLVIANLLNLSIYMPSQIASARGNPHWVSYAWILKFAFLFPLWFVLIPRWGINGAAAGMLIAEILVAAPFLIWTHALTLRLGIFEFLLSSILRPAISSLALGIFGFFFHALIGTWIGLIGFSLLGIFIYLGISYLLIDADAKTLLIEELSLKIR